MLGEQPGIAPGFEDLTLLLRRCKIHIWKKLDPVLHAFVLGYSWLCFYPHIKQGLARPENIPGNEWPRGDLELGAK